MTAPHADRDRTEPPFGSFLDRDPRRPVDMPFEPVDLLPIIERIDNDVRVLVQAWQLEHGDTGRAFWPGHADGAASDSETGGNRATDDAATATLHDTTDDARRRRYADALDLHSFRLASTYWQRFVLRVMDVADTEIRDATARTAWVPDALRSANIDFIDCVNRLADALRRAEAAEAKVARVHEVVDGKAGGFAQAVRAALAEPETTSLRDALALPSIDATATVALKGFGKPETTGRPHPNCHDDRCAGSPPCLACADPESAEDGA